MWFINKIILETVIEVSNISKEYRLGLVGNTSIADDMKRYWAKLRGREDPTMKIGQSNILSQKVDNSEKDYIWALKDINFTVKKGEVLGIIGKNGAGKSTLLKILSKVTAPSTGNINIKGRIASLLEVGTGFHAELTGRENIFLNGAILGMTKAEIRSKFDEIVDFSGVERYIDTPVKRYSSGMYVRLAFAVAAHLDPEILILDEVLAVGDTEFQKKCLGKMEDVSRGGRTILFVSHNMAAVKSLCNSGIFLKNGVIDYANNNIDDVVNKYIKTSLLFTTHDEISKRNDRQGNGDVFVNTLKLLNSVNDNQIEIGKQLGFKIAYYAKPTSFYGKILISINNSNEETVLFMDSSTMNNFPTVLKKNGEIEIKISTEFGLPEGKYFVNIAFFANDNLADYVQSAIVFNVIDGLFYKGGKHPVGKGLCFVKQDWNYNSK